MDDEQSRDLLRLLSGDLARVQRAESRYRYRVLSVKVSSLMLVGAITVLLLGFTPKRSRQAIPTCVALMIGGAITVFNARDLYVRDRRSGIRHRIKLMRLKRVEAELISLIRAEDGENRAKLLDALLLRRQQILDD
jgi:hypothetical protein